MSDSANTCTLCWQGSYINGICSHCGASSVSSENRRADALPLGSVLNNRYLIGDVLGKGGFGVTYSAWDNAAGKRVALKELFPSTSVYRAADRSTMGVIAAHKDYVDALKQKFEEEARLLEMLHGSCNVSTVYDCFSCNNTVYYTMEFLEGCDLKALRKRYGLLNWPTMEPILIDLLETLDQLHEKNLIHRDISPDNIFLTKDRRVILIDFGSARTYQGMQNFTVQKKDGFTPWEQIGSTRKQGPGTDFYALSATVYFLLTGELPPKAEDRVLNRKQLKPLKSLCPSVPEAAAAAIEKGMNVRIEDRFHSAKEYLAALSASASGREKKVPDTRDLPAEPRREPTVKTPEPIPVSSHVSGQDVWLYGLEGHYAGERRRLKPGERLLFGRLDSNTISFPVQTAGVSKVHCELYWDTGSGSVYIRDSGSTFGTYLNERRIGREWNVLRPGSRLRIGNQVFFLAATRKESL